MTNEKMFTELPQDEQKLIIDEVIRLKLTCEPKKMTAAEIYKLIGDTEKNASSDNNNILVDTSSEADNKPVEQPDNVSSNNQPEDEQKKASDSEQKKGPVTEIKNSDGCCITCYADVYNGICSRCGRRY